MKRFLMIVMMLMAVVNSAYAADIQIPILTYHNFEPVKPGIVTISTAKFEEQLKYMKDHGYTVIPLKDAVAYLQGKKKSLPAKPVVITVDDGRITVYQYMLPIIQKYKIPVTLFIYPSITSHESYALTWEQIKKLQQTGYFDIQSHTYWHPDFNQDKKELSTTAYQEEVTSQLEKSKNILDTQLGTHVNLLAWPYGIYNPYLEEQAKKAGYIMAFSIDNRSANRSEDTMSMPRYMVLQKHTMERFVSMLHGEFKSVIHPKPAS